MSFEAGNYAVEPFDTLLLLAKFDEDDANLGLGAQRLGLLALLPAKVGLLGGPTQALLIVITQPGGTHQQVEHHLAFVGVFHEVALHQAFKHLLGRVELLCFVRLAVDFGFEHSGEVVVDVAHEERRVDDDESPAGVLVKDLHSHLGGIERVGRLRAAPVLMPPATHREGCSNYI